MSNVPTPLKPIAHYVKIAQELRSRDLVLHYWCLMYAAQTGMQIDRKSPECSKYLANLLDLLEKFKAENENNEAMHNDLVAQAHIEDYALKLFEWADAQDRAGVFNKNVVKAFYTSGHLFDLLSMFESASDEKIAQQQKYAKWKAAYIHNCLKSGETPIAGPQAQDGEGDDLDNLMLNVPGGDNIDHSSEGTSNHLDPGSSEFGGPSEPAPTNDPPPADQLSANVDVGKLKDIKEVQKLCKYAISALEYEDEVTAIMNLEKALAMLKS